MTLVEFRPDPRHCAGGRAGAWTAERVVAPRRAQVQAARGREIDELLRCWQEELPAYTWDEDDPLSHVARRLALLSGGRPRVFSHALRTFAECRHRLLALSGRSLPAPWVFATEDGTIEFEWQWEDRALTFVIDRDRVVCFREGSGAEPCAEGEPGSTIDQRVRHLQWLVGV